MLSMTQPRGLTVSSPRRRLSTVLLGLSALSFVFGYLAVVVGGDHFGARLSAAACLGLVYLISDTFLLLGALSFPRPALARTSRQRILADAAMIALAATSVSWYFVIGPAVLGRHPTAADVTAAAVAALDLLLLFSLLLLSTHIRRVGQEVRLLILACASGLIIVADSAQVYGTVHGAVMQAPVLAAAHVVGFILTGLAAVLLAKGRDHREGGVTAEAVATPTVWRYLLPYALIPVVVALMVYAAHDSQHNSYVGGLYVLGIVLIELVFVHQFLAYRELIAYSRKSERLETLAAADPITGALNHRTFIAIMDGELERSRLLERPCSLLFIDLDRFKALNDTYGHQAGDAALREFAAVVRTVLRGTDHLGRWGGEEFAAVLAGTGTDEALDVGERVRASVAGHRFRAIGGRQVTCSVGVATFPDHAGKRDELVELADRGMYAAKRLGRNQVQLGTGEEPLQVRDSAG